jgi:hypothetical protein
VVLSNTNTGAAGLYDFGATNIDDDIGQQVAMKRMASDIEPSDG